MKHTLTKLKVDIDSLAILVEVFNILLSVMDKELQKFHKETRTSTKLYID